MKAAIFTPPLQTDYGGNLQVFTLQRTLSRLSYDVVTINCARNGAYRSFMHQLPSLVSKEWRKFNYAFN